MNRLIILVISIIFTACGTSSENNTVDDNVTLVEAEELAARIHIKDEPVEIITPGIALQANLPDNFSLRLIAEIDAPDVADVIVQATDVTVGSKFAYVTYNVQGDVQRGALDAIDISKVGEPMLTSELQFAGLDANALAIKAGSVIFTGAENEVGAYVASTTVKNGVFDTNIIKKKLTSFAGTDIVVSGSEIWAASGDQGGVYLLNDNLDQLSEFEIFDARALGTRGSSLYALSGQPATLYAIEEDLGDPIDVGGAKTPQSKSTIDIGSQWALTTAGEEGWKIVCLADGTIVHHEEAITVAGVDPASTVTNAASAEGSMVYVANGEAGVYVYQLKTKGAGCKAITTSLVGYLSLGEGLSANHVYSRGNTVFVADGLGGLKILRKSRDKTDDDIDDFDDEVDD